MNFDASEFKLREIANECKESIENKFFRLTVKDKDYVIIIPRIRSSLLEAIIFNRDIETDDNNPIEHKITVFRNELNMEFDIFDDERLFYFPSLSVILEEYPFELSELNEVAINFVNSLYNNGELVSLIMQDINFKSLETPSNRFERKFSNFIREICLKEINTNTSLQENLIEKKKQEENKKKELEEHMKTVREKEHKIQEFNENMPSYESKNSSSYNIRW